MDTIVWVGQVVVVEEEEGMWGLSGTMDVLYASVANSIVVQTTTTTATTITASVTTRPIYRSRLSLIMALKLTSAGRHEFSRYRT